MQGFLIGLIPSMDLQVLVGHERGLAVLSRAREGVQGLPRRQVQEQGDYKRKPYCSECGLFQ